VEHNQEMPGEYPSYNGNEEDAIQQKFCLIPGQNQSVGGHE
jgi:hypothetical protein